MRSYIDCCRIVFQAIGKRAAQEVSKQMKGGKKQYYQLLVSDKTRY